MPRFSCLNIVCHHAGAHHNRRRIQRRRRQAVIKLDFTCKLTLTGGKNLRQQTGLVSIVCHDGETLVPRLYAVEPLFEEPMQDCALKLQLLCLIFLEFDELV